ncbi:MAG TPA: 3-phosphoserine/phosphohydroxythreonine transaminase [Oscillospiraceae bacterium]|nr:3-phosphoserine/phosphohydroxythreonine transaminase [Oscillospiraceae bacterium]
MENRVYNFNPGPATLPLTVLQQAQAELLNYKGTGMSILEMSHRAKEFDEIVLGTEALFKELTGLGDDYRVLFCQGGASQQFAMLPLNFLTQGKSADYLITGSFADKAFKEAKKIGSAQIAATTADDKHNRIPTQEELTLQREAAYVHLTTNNTIYGTEWHYIPQTDAPLVADMSSDILSRPWEYQKFALIYAGAQKNLGPAGVTVVLIRQDMLSDINAALPTMFNYDTFASKNSMYNTPPTFSIYLLQLVLKWVQAQGGLTVLGQQNKEKAALLYEALDEDDFYRGHAQVESRSLMNVTFRLPNEELEKAFVAAAAEIGLAGLKGHRSVGGIRASIYNAMSPQGCETLASFMHDFKKRNR